MRNNLLESEGGYDGGAMMSGTSNGYSDEAGVKKFFSTAPAPITRRTLSLLLISLSLLSVVLLIALATAVAKDSATEPLPTPYPPLSSSTGGSAPSPSSTGGPAPSPGSYFASTVGIPELWRHLNALQAIADANNGTRAIGSSGFNASVQYIYDTLLTTHFDVTQHTFQDTAWLLSEPHVAWGPPTARLTQQYQTAYHVMTYSGSAHVTNASLVTVDGGCTDASFAGFPRGAIAITLATTTCGNAARATRAAQFGAAAILIYQQRTVRTFLSGGVAAYTPIGAFLLPFTTGIALAELADSRGPGGVTIDLNLTTTTGLTGVTNTCATSRHGNPNRTIVSGSHCDSVPAGAGVNDNGSGTSLNLALALALNERENDPAHAPFVNRVKFCWWAAEEVGLHGSQEFVRQARLEGLKGENGIVGERIPQDIQANLNYDIVGSPNFVFGVWDGNTFTGPNQYTPRSVNGSLAITAHYERYFNRSGLTYSYRPLDNRSDYKSFHDAGVAAGGATSGREDQKTLEERNRYARLLGPGGGGMPGVNYDVCYHQRCDQVWGVNPRAIVNLTHSAGFVLEELARMDDLVGFLQYPAQEKTSWTAEEAAEEMRTLEANFARSTKAFLEATFQ